MNERTQKAIEQLAEIDELILIESLYRSNDDPDHFMGFVHQKEGLHDLIKEETGKTAQWTPDGYRLR